MLSVQFFIGVVIFPITAFGAMTATGLIRRRNWARIAALVWAVVMALVSGFALLAGVFIVLQSHVIELKSLFFFSLFGAGLANGVWWLVLFTRNHVIEQFSSK